MSVKLVVEDAGSSTDYPSMVRQFIGGDRRAGEALAQNVRSILLRRLRRYAPNGQVAEELAQDCVLQVFARLPEYEADKGYFEAWVSGFAMNALRANRRRELRSKITDLPVEEITEASYDMTEFEDERDLLSSALNTLDALDQELLHMRYSLGMSSDEIADRSDMNAPTVRKRISRAVERLRRHPAIAQIVR